jgi:SAM-dependent methyltransferase
MGANESLTNAYAQRLSAISRSRWRRYLGVQLPYCWNLRRIAHGLTLEVGCGTGRNLRHLRGRVVGVDPNLACVEEARSAGLEALSPQEFATRYSGPSFDSLLFSHVLEHCLEEEGVELVKQYLPYLKPAGRVIFETPQEAGFRSDATHVNFVTDRNLSTLCSRLGLAVSRSYSFPFPRWVGRFFLFNEFVVVATKP